MVDEKRYAPKLVTIFLSLLLGISLVVPAGEVSVTPLLDTPNNRSYYDHLIESVRAAEDSIEVLMATADHYPDHPGGIQSRLFDALGAASDRGVRVRVILDESDFSQDITEANRETAGVLRDHGVEVKLYDPGTTNHAKLVVVDARTVLLGSSNWNYPTYTETYQSNFRLVDEKVGRFYRRVFEKAWKGDRIEELKLPPPSGEKEVIPLISTGESRMYFEEAARLIEAAEESIDLVLFKITRYPEFPDSRSNRLLEKLAKAHSRGVKVRIILDVNTWSDDVNQSNRETALWLLGRGIRNVSFDSKSITTHSKVMIVDGESVLLGSTNWSYYSLAENLEVDVSIRSAPSVGRAFGEYFERLWEKAEIPSREELSGALRGN
ncbi:MAG: phospholipase D-like domain-containing protein [Candidatus Bipolaricaulota bacterium]